MKLPDLVKPLDQLTEAELMERLREVRHRRTVDRPAARARVERAERKVSRSRVSSVERMLTGLSEEDRIALIQQLEEQETNSG